MRVWYSYCMRQYIKLFLLMFASMFLTQCAAPTQNTSKTLRIVEYNGYIERDSLESLIKWNLEHKKETVLIFGAHWCGACQNLKILSEEAGVNLEHVKFVDIDDPWVASIAADIGFEDLPRTGKVVASSSACTPLGWAHGCSSMCAYTRQCLTGDLNLEHVAL